MGINSQKVSSLPQDSQMERSFPHQGSPFTLRWATTLRKDPRDAPKSTEKTIWKTAASFIDDSSADGFATVHFLLSFSP
jgi:hypothetical protein